MDYSDSSLIVRLPNWVGDVVMTLPILQALNQQGLKLQLVGKPWITDLLAALEMPLFTLEKKFWASKNKIATIPSSKALLLTNSLSSALLTRLAGKETIGYRSDKRQLLLKQSIAKPIDVHEIEYFWRIAHVAQQYWFPELSWPDAIPSKIHLPISDKSLSSAKNILKNKGITEPFWILCPFAHGTGLGNQSKIWPYWRKLSLHLAGHNIVVCPGPNEEQLCEQFVPEATVLPGLNLAEYSAVLSLAEQVIANDSGPMHIAAAVNPKTLGIFGVSDPQRTRPWGADFIGSKNNWPSLKEVIKHLAT